MNSLVLPTRLMLTWKEKRRLEVVNLSQQKTSRKSIRLKATVKRREKFLNASSFNVAPVVHLQPGDRGAACAEALALADLLGHELGRHSICQHVERRG